ncbi:MAG: CocE/NonD family hydrolase [Candidatus Latescibacterota bacterium]
MEAMVRRHWVLTVSVFLLNIVLIAGAYGQTELPVLIEEQGIIAPGGKKLATTIARPDRPGKYPAIVFRTPYGLGWMKTMMERYAKRGYVCIAQDVRGRHGSDGVFVPFLNEIPDSDATLRWIRSQPWSNGAVGTNGHSYLGFTALYAAAGKEAPPKVIVANDPVASPKGGLYTNGAMNHHFDYYWSILVDGRILELQQTIALDWENLFPLLPLKDAHRGVNREIGFYDEWVDWANGSFGAGKLPEPTLINCDSTAVLLLGGWFDLFCTDVVNLYGQLRAKNGKERVKLIIGPFDHGSSPPPESDIEFGNWQALNINAVSDRWQDRWLLGSANGVETEPSVRFFLLGENQWADADAWPPEGAKEQSLFLRSDGKANSLIGSGRLDERAPGKEPVDRFSYDPGNPVPTRGGSICCLREMTKAGAMDQREIEQREDVLVYTSEELKNDLTVAGPVALELFAATSARDTDFTGKLVDVHPDGKAINIVESIVRARFRNGMDAPQFVKPGAVERYRFTLGHTAVTFRKGHCIRLEVSSSNFPRFDRNMNTGGPIGTESTFVTANQTIRHDREHLSRLILTVWERK